MGVLNGRVQTNNGYQGRYYYVDWTSDQSVGNNCSTIHWVLSCAGGAVGQWGPLYYVERTLYVNVAGNVVMNKTNNVNRYPGQIADGYIVVNHNANGDASFSIDIKAATYTANVNCTGFGTFELNTIARASQPSCKSFPHNTENVGDMGTSIYIHMNRASNSFTHNVRYTFGSATGIIGTNVTDNVLWTIPLDLAYQIPNSTSGWGTISVDTFNGSSHIGTKTCRFICSVPTSVKPSISSCGVHLDNSLSSVAAAWGIYISGISKARISASASSSYGATINSFTITGGYNTVVVGSSLSYTAQLPLSAGNKSFYVTAKDSRGRVSETMLAGSISVNSYSRTNITSLVAKRGTGSTATVYANWSFASLDGRNTTSAKITYPGNQNGVSISKGQTITLSGISEEHSYAVTLFVTDALGETVSQETIIPTQDVLLDFRAGGHGLGIGKIAETDSMEVFMNAKFMKDLWITDVSYKGDNINLRNVRSLVDWNKLLNKPSAFPPASHTHDYLPTSGGVITGTTRFKNGIQMKPDNGYGWLDFYYDGKDNPEGSIYVTRGTEENSYNKSLTIKGWKTQLNGQEGSDNGHIIVLPREGDGDGWLAVTGNVVYSNQCFQWSSRRYKDNIEDIPEEEANKLMLLNPVTFDYKNTGAHSSGFIAEDTEPYFPNLIMYAGDKINGLNYIGLIPYLVKKIQMQQKEIDKLKNK